MVQYDFVGKIGTNGSYHSEGIGSVKTQEYIYIRQNLSKINLTAVADPVSGNKKTPIEIFN